MEKKKNVAEDCLYTIKDYFYIVERQSTKNVGASLWFKQNTMFYLKQMFSDLH